MTSLSSGWGWVITWIPKFDKPISWETPIKLRSLNAYAGHKVKSGVSHAHSFSGRFIVRINSLSDAYAVWLSVSFGTVLAGSRYYLYLAF